MNDTNMIGGFYPKQKHPNAPDFVIAKLNINVDQFRDWMKGYLAANPSEEWISVDMKVSKNGKGYAVVDDWKPQQNTPPAAAPAAQQDDFGDKDIPF